MVVCRFADLDPFARSNFFGWSLDLGQFTRFQRVFHIRPFSLLLRHTHAERLSSLQVIHMCNTQHVWTVGDLPAYLGNLPTCLSKAQRAFTFQDRMSASSTHRMQ